MAKKLSALAKNIRKIRKKKGLSQDRLSKLADISHITVIKIESGAIKSPTVGTAQKIAKALNISINDLVS